ncbi:hypothetical protein EMCRGX_G013637, partial [Ephydatia muelleri]
AAKLDRNFEVGEDSNSRYNYTCCISQLELQLSHENVVKQTMTSCCRIIASSTSPDVPATHSQQLLCAQMHGLAPVETPLYTCHSQDRTYSNNTLVPSTSWCFD